MKWKHMEGRIEREYGDARAGRPPTAFIMATQHVNAADQLAPDASTADLLPPDALALILAQLATADLLACACVSTALRKATGVVLHETKALWLSGTEASDVQLDRLVKRMRGTTRALDISSCPNLSKSYVVKRVMRASPSMTQLNVRALGLGSWTPSALSSLLAAAPRTLRDGTIEADVRVAINVDVPACCALLAHPALHARRLTLVTNLRAPTQQAAAQAAPPVAPPQPVALAPAEAVEIGDPAEDAQADAAAAAANIALAHLQVVAAAAAAAAAASAANAAQANENAEPLPLSELAQLEAVLTRRADLQYLDASSGALGVEGIDQLVSPLLRAESCVLRWLAISAVPRESAATLIAAVAANRSLQTLQLGCNSLDKAAAVGLGHALGTHPSLARLKIEHNQTLDVGGAALLASCEHNGIQAISLAFTGAADATCEAAARAIRAYRPLASLDLCGNGVGAAAVAQLAAALDEAGPSSSLCGLNLSCNVWIDSAAVATLGKVLPRTNLRRLELSGCCVNGKTAGLLAATLPACRIEHLDLSANPGVGDVGAWALAWALPDATSLVSLILYECAITDDGATELCEALDAPAEADCTEGGTQQQLALRLLDLRGNRISKAHPITLDARVKAGFQRKAASSSEEEEVLEREAMSVAAANLGASMRL